MKADRRSVAQTLTRMAVTYLTHQRFSVYVELGLAKWGSLRADVIGVKMSGELVIIEVKSCRQDFVTDKKYHRYLEYADRVYMLWPQDYGLPLADRVGLLLPTDRGYLRVERSAVRQPIAGPVRKRVICGMAWRAGTFNRTNTRRTRMFLTKDNNAT